MTLDGLESAVYTSVGSTEHARRQSKLNVIRYADDFVVTGVAREVLKHKVLPAVKQFMAVRGLELSDEKTRITHISAGFDFLGQNVRKYSGKLLIKPAKKSVKSLICRVRGIIKANASVTQAGLVQQLNPVIRGWTLYHRHVVAKACYSSIDSQIWQLLWKWAVRRHPTKGARWVRQKYFCAEGNRSWVFATKSPFGDANQRLRLFRAMTLSIVRHVKIRSTANPFDPAWTSYFARRRTAMDSEPLLGATAWC